MADARNPLRPVGQARNNAGGAYAPKALAAPLQPQGQADANSAAAEEAGITADTNPLRPRPRYESR